MKTRVVREADSGPEYVLKLKRGQEEKKKPRIQIVEREDKRGINIQK